MRWQRVKAIAVRQAHVLQRSPHRLYDITIWPVVDTVLFGSLGVFLTRDGDTTAGEVALASILCGIVLWHVLYQAQIALATGFLEETWSRGLLSLMVSPISELEYVAGVALFGLVKLALGVGLVALLAFTAYAFNVTALGLGLIPVIALLLMVGWAVALFVIGLVLRFGTGAEALAWGILFCVMPLSGVFYPVDALPGILRPVSLALPTTHAFIAGRSLIADGTMDYGELGLAAVTVVLFTLAAMVFLAKMLAVFRKRGYITRYS